MKYKIKKLFVSTYFSKNAEFVVDFYYLNNKQEFVNIFSKQKLVFEGNNFNKKNYVDNCKIEDDILGIDTLKNYILNNKDNISLNTLWSQHNSYIIKENKNYILLKNNKTITNTDFFISPLFVKNNEKLNYGYSVWILDDITGDKKLFDILTLINENNNDDFINDDLLLEIKENFDRISKRDYSFYDDLLNI